MDRPDPADPLDPVDPVDPVGEDRVPGEDADRPRWRLGAQAAVAALGLALVVQGLVQYLTGSGGDEPAAETLSFTTGIGGWPVAAAAVAFVLFARPWRLLGRRGRAG